MLTLAVAGAGAWAWGAFKVKRSPQPAPVAANPVAVPDLASARQILTGYFEATEDEGRIRCLHDSRRVGALWLDYHHRRNKPVPLLVRLDQGRLARLGDKTVAMFQTELDPGGSRPIALIWDDGRFGIDWESSVVYGSMDWIEWVETKPASTQLLRVYLSRSRVDGLSVAEREAGWSEVVAEHPDGLQPLPVRIPPGVLFPVDFHGRQRVPAAAELRFSRSNAELVKFLHEGWSR
ncbi:hypothetical protein KBB96_05335 [Luteolibacter ambystomatis]|uniref:Uncharacterized protein n=1 Tax=Luteolibacter ambystomatis TaxID=2824561 RepID=A0A975PG61_9BACT|nr:hypothetical protein [Luteolibacter ambystomatis]QUE52315.1 hypothetical protein KBB96_05335 [Luteolibacter ambystomatis]